MIGRDEYLGGELAKAIEFASKEVKKNPNSLEQRSFLVELLCIAGDFARADKQLDIIGQHSPQVIAGVVLIRQLIKAAQLRCDSMAKNNNLPIDSKVEKIQGRCNGKEFALFRDLDDICANFFEVLTPKGQYSQLPFSDIAAIRFAQPKRPLDYLWRLAHIKRHSDNGSEIDVYVPVTYFFAGDELAESLLLARETRWEGDGPVLGVGQRMFLVNDEAVPFLEIDSIEFNNV